MTFASDDRHGALPPGGPDPPFFLQVLGPVVVRRPADSAASSIVTQPRHLAMLCYLALARPRGLHSRDALGALLWPDDDQEHVRRAVRNALHAIRRLLGNDAIVGAGRGLVGLATARIGCDAHDLERGEWCAPRGPAPHALPEPLHGLHVGNAAPFDHWLAAERDRLRALLQQAANGADSTPQDTLHPRGRLSAGNAEVMCARGDYLFLRAAHGGQAEELARARQCFERALVADPACAPALAGLANYFAVAGRRGILAPFRDAFAQAIALSERALALDPTLAAPHVHFAVRALYLDDDFERAGAEFRAAVSVQPDYAEAHRFHGVWLGLAGRKADALAAMERAARLEPDIPHILSSLAAAQRAVGQGADAERTLRLVLEIDPRHRPARERLVALLEDGDRHAEAVEWRSLPPALAGADAFADALATDGAEGYRRELRAALRASAEALEERVRHPNAGTAEDIFSPPIVRLVLTYARLGEWKRAKAWRLQAIAARPALARWIDAELPRETALD